MDSPAAGASTAILPWLWPDAQSLTAIGQPLTESTWYAVRRDPAAVLLLLRSRSVAEAVIHPAQLLDPQLLKTVGQWFTHDIGTFVDWRLPVPRSVYRTSLAIAHHAAQLATLTGRCDSHAAWAAGLLAPLGWMAMLVRDADLIVNCLTHPSFAEEPLEVEEFIWGADHAAVARQLADEWNLPRWLGDAAGWSDGSRPPADADLHAHVRLAVLLAEQAGYSLGLSEADDELSLLKQLGLKSADFIRVKVSFAEFDFSEIYNPGWQDPTLSEDLAEDLREIRERRQMADLAPLTAMLGCELDRARQAVETSRAHAAETLRLAKLEALAEFSGGASHEINNPLAVIAGQCQYLLKRSPDEALKRSLESMLRQTQRIHTILAELMQYARPPKLTRQRVRLADVVDQSVAAFAGHADEAGVSLEVVPADGNIVVDADPRQLATALGCLIRNAIEATAASRGRVAVGVEQSADRASIYVEDDGRGLSPLERERMYDPFFSGRQAGRGRGLGLPTAWRLAHEHGGDVTCTSRDGEPTRFLLTLPLPDCRSRQSA